MGSLSSLLFAVAFFVGNRECHSLKVTETYYKQNSLTDCLHKFNLVADIHVKSLKEDLIEGLEEGVEGTPPTYNMSYNCQFVSKSKQCQCTIEGEIIGPTDNEITLSTSALVTSMENPATSSTSPSVSSISTSPSFSSTSTDASPSTSISSEHVPSSGILSSSTTIIFSINPSTSNFFNNPSTIDFSTSPSTSNSATIPPTSISSTSPSTSSSSTNSTTSIPSTSPTTNIPPTSPTTSTNNHFMLTATSSNPTGNVDETSGEAQGHGIFVLMAGLLLLVVLVLGYIAYQKRQQIWDQISAKIWYVKKRSHTRKAGRYTALPQTLHDTVLHQD